MNLESLKLFVESFPLSHKKNYSVDTIAGLMLAHNKLSWYYGSGSMMEYHSECYYELYHFVFSGEAGFTQEEISDIYQLID